MTMLDLLMAVGFDQLFRRARSLGVPVSPGGPWHQTLTAVAARLSSPSYIDKALAELTAAQRDLLMQVHAYGGYVPVALLGEDMDTAVAAHAPLRDPRSADHAHPTPLIGLWERSLVFVTRRDGDQFRGDHLAIPDEVARRLPPPERRPFVDMLTAHTPPARQRVGIDPLPDICTLLCYLQRETVRPVMVDRLAKRDLVRLNQEMTIQENVASMRSEDQTTWIKFVHYLAGLAGLISLKGSVLGPSDKAERWLAQSRDRRLRGLWQSFSQDASWVDLEHSTSAFNYAYGVPPGQIAPKLRACVVLYVARCPIGQWVSLEQFLEAIKRDDFAFLRSLEAATGAHNWPAVHFYGTWNDTEAPFVRHVVGLALAAFGIVDLGFGAESGQLEAFRLTETGALLLSVKEGTLPDAPAQPITVQPNYEIVVPAEAAPAVVFTLQQFSQLATRDRASIYRLTKTVLWRFLQAGGDIDRVISFLETASRRDLPQNVSYALREWAGRHGEIVIDQANLILTTDEVLLTELRANKKLRMNVRDVLSPRAAVLPHGDVSSLIADLQKAGYWPKLGDGLQASAENTAGGAPTARLSAHELTQLLASALALRAIAKEMGWRSPLSDYVARNLTWRLPPAQVKGIDRMVNEILASFHEQSDEKST